MSENDFNEQVIAEFRANGGKVSGMFEGAPLVLVHHTGAKSGTERVTPLMYQQIDADTVAVFASKGGHTSPPDWYHNLRANPETTIELGAETRRVRAREADEEQRARIWEAQKQAFPNFAEYEKTANRTIPVILLEPAA